MSEKIDDIRRLKLGQSIRMIHKETGIHRTITRQIKSISEYQGWMLHDGKLPTIEELNAALSSDEKGAPGHVLDSFIDDIKVWLKDDTSYVIIHDHLQKRGVPCSEATVRRYIHRKFPEDAAPRAVMLRNTIPGEIMEVDFPSYL